MRLRFHTADVFTTEPFGGNPLAVFPAVEGLDSETMQRVAAEFALSETVFVLPPEDPRHTRKVRIFTPKKELPFAGHPTIGTAMILSWIGEIPSDGDGAQVVLEEGVGPVPVRLLLRNGRAYFAEFSSPKLPELRTTSNSIDDIAGVLSLEPRDICTGALAPRSISCGIPFLFVALAGREALGRARLNRVVWETKFADSWAKDLYLFTRDARDSDVSARMFGPGVGIEEDPASGSAVAALAAFLTALSSVRSGTLKWTVEQGRDLGRPSTLGLEADVRDGNVISVRVGGSAVPMTEGFLQL